MNLGHHQVLLRARSLWVFADLERNYHPQAKPYPPVCTKEDEENILTRRNQKKEG